MTGKENLKLGLIGCGAIAEFAYLPASRHLEGATIVGVADKNISRARMLGRQYGITNCVDDYRQLLGQVDGVVLALPHDLHAPVATEFLTAKTAVLVEKPLALTTSEAEQVVELARTN